MHRRLLEILGTVVLLFLVPGGARAQSAQYYVLDGFGGVHAGGGAPALSPSSPYFGFDVAVDMVQITSAAGDGYLILDALGGVHAAGVVASVAPGTPYFGFNVARAIAPRNSNLALLDGDNVFTGQENRFEGKVQVLHQEVFGFQVTTDMPSADRFGIQAIIGEYNNATGQGTGVMGLAVGVDGIGVQGHADVDNGGIGVTGAAANPGGIGVLGLNPATSGFSTGVTAESHSPDGPALNVRSPGGGDLIQGNDSGNNVVFLIGNDGQIVQGSSAALKTDIEALDGALAKVLRLNGVRFRWRSSSRADMGFIAEEVAEVIPEVVHFDAEGERALGLEYGRLTALLVEAVKEQEARIRELEARVEELGRRR